MCNNEACSQCGLDPSVIVAFEPLGSLSDPPPKERQQRPGRSPHKPRVDRRSRAELAAENAALRAELEALRHQT
ncbi:hypothetical protein WN71_034180 [Streptomyces mangrovisoli]|uniref:Uncharacterized protein n=2 Tax=Streptomyces mangrovisoli TaxID=1428628 RepID=A0A1J4NQI2_9ACTN|nr:hypothetical protein WN71_034180 [Streptomyces mangrovisoli]